MGNARRLAPVAAAANLTAVVLTVAAALLLLPAFPGSDAPVPAAERLALAARLGLWPALVLFGMVGGVMAARARSLALNPIDDPESRFCRIAQRVLQNSVEQTLVFLPALAALAIQLPPARLGVPELATTLFVAGRLMFWAGYHIHPYVRAPGMAVTMTVNLGVVAWGVALAL